MSTCLNILTNLAIVTDETNDMLTNNIIDSKDFQSLCVREDISYQKYAEIYGKKWEDIINNFIKDSKCDNSLVNKITTLIEGSICLNLKF